MPVHWYAIASHPNKEDALWRQLQAKQVEVYYPRLAVQPVNPRARKVKPYFPGYMFLRTDLDCQGLSFFQYMPYAKGLICFGGEPAVVPDSLISTLQARIKHVDGSQQSPVFLPGELVLVHEGPFAGYQAIFDAQLPGSERVRVLLKILNDRRLPLELRSRQVIKPS